MGAGGSVAKHADAAETGKPGAPPGKRPAAGAGGSLQEQAKANAEGGKLLQDAKVEAADIVRRAKAEAALMVKRERDKPSPLLALTLEIETAKSQAISLAKAKAAEDILALVATLPKAGAAAGGAARRAPPRPTPAGGPAGRLPPLEDAPAPVQGNPFGAPALGNPASATESLEEAMAKLKAAAEGLLSGAREQAAALVAAAGSGGPDAAAAVAAANNSAAASALMQATQARAAAVARAAEDDAAARRRQADEALARAAAEAESIIRKAQEEAAAALAAAQAAARPASAAAAAAASAAPASRFADLLQRLQKNTTPDCEWALNWWAPAQGESLMPTLAGALAKNTSLQELDFSGVSLTPADVKALAGMLGGTGGGGSASGLQILRLGAAQLDDRSGDAVSTLAMALSRKQAVNLRELDLQDASLTSEGALTLAQAVRASRGLRTVSLPTAEDGSVRPEFAEAQRRMAGPLARNGDLAEPIGREALEARVAEATASLQSDWDWSSSRQMNGWGLTGTDLARLCEAATGSSVLTNLTLANNPEMGLAGSGQPAPLAALAAMLADPSCALTTLDLSRTGISGEAALQNLAAGLAANKSLASLTLVDNGLSAASLRILAPACAGLKELYLGENPLGPAGGALLAELLRASTTLATVDLSDCELGVEGVAALAGAATASGTLRALTLAGSPCAGTAAGAEISAALARNAWAAERAAVVAVEKDDALPKLLLQLWKHESDYSLSLRGWALTSDELRRVCEAMQGNTSTYVLDLSENVLSVLGAKHVANLLGANTTLTAMMLSGCNLGQTQIQELAPAIAGSASLQRLSLNANPNLGADAALRLVAQAVGGAAALKDVDLSLCGIRDVEPLAATMPGKGSLTSVNLAGNPGEESDAAARLKAALRKNAAGPALAQASKAVSELIEQMASESITYGGYALSSVPLSLADVGRLADALATNGSLQDINLYKTGVTAAGVQLLVKALILNSSLTEFRCDGNLFGDAAAFAFATLLRESFTLTLLDLDNSRISAAGGAALAEALRTNTTLQTLRHRCNPFDGDESSCEIRGLLSRNSDLAEAAANAPNKESTLSAITAADACVTVRNLTLARKDVRALAAKLAPNEALTDLELRGTFSSAALAVEAFGVLHLPAVMAKPTLTRLTLWNCKINAESMRLVAEGLARSPALGTLVLGNNGFGAEAVAVLAPALARHAKLTDLRFEFNPIGDQGASALAEALRVNSVLTKLDLDTTAVGQAGLREIAAAVRANPRSALATVWADNCAASNSPARRELNEAIAQNVAAAAAAQVLADVTKAAAVLAGSPAEGASADSVYLTYMGLKAEYLRPLLAPLASSTTVTTLMLYGNDNFGDAGAAGLAPALRANKALVSLSLSNCGIGPAGVAALVDAMRAGAPALTSVDLSGNPGASCAAAAEVARLAGSNALRALEASKAAEKPALFATLLEQLRAQQSDTCVAVAGLALTASEVGEFADALAGNTSTLELDLWGTQLSGAPLKTLLTRGLKPNKVLTGLTLRGTSLGPVDAGTLGQVLAACDKLTSLDLGGMDTFDGEALAALVGPLRTSPGLQTLCLDSMALGPKPGGGAGRERGLAELLMRPAPHLTTVSAVGCGLGAAGIAALASALDKSSAQTLLTLDLRNNGTEVGRRKGLRQIEARLKKNAEVIETTARAKAAGDATRAIFAGEGNAADALNGLTLTEAQALEAADAVRNSSGLVRLSASGASFAEGPAPAAAALAAAAAANPTVTSLVLTGCGLDNAAAAAVAASLAGNNGLTSIELDNNSISFRGAHALLRMLEANTTISCLSLSGNPCEGTEPWHAMQRALTRNRDMAEVATNKPGRAQLQGTVIENLKLNYTWYLSLRNYGFTSPELHTVLEALLKNTSCGYIDMYGQPIDEANARLLAQVFAKHPAIESVDLSKALPPTILPILAPALGQLATLTSLTLEQNALGPAEAQALATSLKAHTGLSTLTLSQNPLGDAGAAAVAELVRASPSLNTVTLTSCGIERAGAVALASAVDVSQTITTLMLDGNMGQACREAQAMPAKMASNQEFVAAASRARAIEAQIKALKEAAAGSDVYLQSLAYVAGFTPEQLQLVAAAAGATAANSTQLQLYSMGMTAAHVAALTEGLKEGLAALPSGESTKLSLCLSYNESLGDEGAARLAELLAAVPRLTSLELAGCGIGEAGAEALAAVLPGTLIRFDVCSNPLEGTAAHKRMVALLESNVDLKEQAELAPEKPTRLAEQLSSLRSNLGTYVSFRNLQLTEAELERVTSAIGLNKSCIDLDLRGNSAFGPLQARDLVQSIKSNTTLTSLSLARTPLGSAGVWDIARMLAKDTCRLGTLNLTSCGIGTEGVQTFAEALATNNYLCTLTLDGNPGAEDAAAMAAMAPHLARNVVAAEVRRVEACVASTVAELTASKPEYTYESSLWGCVLTEDQVARLARALANNTSLTYINWYSCLITSEGAANLAAALKQNRTLETLRLECNVIGDAGAAALADVINVNPIIDVIDLDGNQINAEGARAFLRALKTNTTLSNVEIGWGNPCCGDALFAEMQPLLDRNAAARTLARREVSVANMEAKLLANAADCAGDELCNEQLSDEQWARLSAALARNTVQKQMCFYYTSAGPAAAKALAGALAKNTQLAELRLDNNTDVGDEGARALAGALAANTALKMLDLESCSIGDEGAAALAEALLTNTTLLTLRLGRNNCTYTPMVETTIAERLARNVEAAAAREAARVGALVAAACAALQAGRLAELDTVEWFKLSPAHAAQLAGALAGNTTLTKVNLVSSGVDAEVLSALVPALGAVPSLRSIRLDGNPLGSDGVQVLADALSKGGLAALANLSLEKCDVGAAGVGALVGAVASHAALATLSIDGNWAVGNEGIKLLAEALKTNSVLVSLDLDGTGFDEEGAKLLLEGIKANKSVRELSMTGLACTDGPAAKEIAACLAKPAGYKDKAAPAAPAAEAPKEAAAPAEVKKEAEKKVDEVKVKN